MDNTSYPEYLKRQSDEDLVAIRNSIDKLAHAERYAQIVAEIETRARLLKSRASTDEARLDVAPVLTGAFSTWLNEHFLVRPRKAWLVIVFITMVVTIALEVSLIVCKQTDAEFFLNKFDWLTDKLIRYSVAVVVCVFTLLGLSGIYNFIAHLFGKK